MSSPRVRTVPIANSLLGTRPKATAPESELILAVGTMTEQEPEPSTSSVDALTLGALIQWHSKADLAAMTGPKAYVFAVPAEMPAAGESFNWEFLATSTLVFFLAPNPIFEASTEVQADAFHSTHPLTVGQQFFKGGHGINFPAPEGFLVPETNTLYYINQIQPMRDAFMQAQQNAVAAVATALHASPPAPADPLAGTPGTPPLPSSTTSLGPPSQPVLAGFLVKDREGRQYPCLSKTDPVACIIKLSAATRFMSPDRFNLLFEHVVIDMEAVERRITKHGQLAQSAKMPDSHPLKSLGKSEGLSNLPLRSSKHAASFRQFILCDLRSMDQSVVGWWCFCPTPFKTWAEDSTVVGREQLRLCLLGMQDALATYHDAIFKDVWEEALVQVTHVNKPLRHYTDVFIAVQLWRIICLPYADAMDEKHSSLVPSHPIASPADNYALIKKSVADSMTDMLAGNGVWAERKPHFDFMDKEAGLFKQVIWMAVREQVASPFGPTQAKKEKDKKRKAEEAEGKIALALKRTKAKGAAKVPAKAAHDGPCIYHLAGQLKIKVSNRVVSCGTQMLKTNGVCLSGWHCDVASMTRAQCEKVASASTWAQAPVVLAGVKAADAKSFAP